MKLLFDQNLSHRLVGLLADLFPGSLHVAECGLADADDRMIWSFARDLNYVIASKDSDFSDLSFLFGAPPKAVWVRVGNGPTSVIAELLRSQAARLREDGEFRFFFGAPPKAVLVPPLGFEPRTCGLRATCRLPQKKKKS